MGRSRPAVARGRAFLIDWDPASAAERAGVLTADGWTVRTESNDGALALKHMRDEAPDVIAIDLSRLPSHGRETARAVRQYKGLRDVPIVFFGGTPDAQARARALVPGALVVAEADLAGALASAL